MLPENAELKNIKHVMHKFPVNDALVVSLPPYTNMRHFAYQHAVATIWAEVPEESMGPLFDFQLTIIGTGEGIPENGRHVKTWMQKEYVWHAYLVPIGETNGELQE